MPRTHKTKMAYIVLGGELCVVYPHFNRAAGLAAAKADPKAYKMHCKVAGYPGVRKLGQLVDLDPGHDWT